MPENSKAQFFIDELYFQDLSELPVDWCRQVANILYIAEDILKSPLPLEFKPILWVSDLFWDTELQSGKSLASLVFDKFYTDGLTRDEVIRLQVIVSRSSQFDFAELVRNEDALSNGHGKTKCETCDFGGLLTNRDSEVFSDSEHWDARYHFPIKLKEELKKFYRGWIVSTSQPKNVFYEYAHVSFENLFLHNTLNFNRFNANYESLLKYVISHLSFLNDSIQDIFIEQNNQPNQITARANALANIDISPENPSTHENTRAMAERDIVVSGEKVCCEWHTKLFWDEERIHFHPGLNQSEDVNKITHGRVIVGIFAKHLST